MRLFSYITFLIVGIFFHNIIVAQADTLRQVSLDTLLKRAAPNTAIKIGIGWTAYHYVGDLTDEKYAWNRFSPGVHFSLQPEGRRHTNFIVNVGFAAIQEQTDSPNFNTLSSSNIRPNRYVHSRFIYGDIGLRYRFRKQYRTQFFVQTGGGFLFFQPEDKKEVGLLDQDKSRLEGETYSLIMLQAPVTVGIERKLSPNYSVSMSYTYRFLASDYLDNIGKAGTKQGNDQLHALQLALHFVPNPSKQQHEIFIPPVDSAILLSDTLLALRSLHPPKDSLTTWLKTLPKTAPKEEDYSDLLNSSTNWLYEIGAGLVKPDVPKKPVVVKEDLIDEGDYDDYAWMWRQLEEKAILENEYFLYDCQEGETYYSLYERFRVRGSIIRQLNGLGGTTIPPTGKPIWIPDLGQWLEIFPDVERIVKESGVKEP